MCFSKMPFRLFPFFALTWHSAFHINYNVRSTKTLNSNLFHISKYNHFLLLANREKCTKFQGFCSYNILILPLFFYQI